MIYEFSTPLIKTLIGTLRSVQTDALHFRHTVKEITKILLYESLKEAPTQLREVQTWQGMHKQAMIKEEDYVVVTVLRAGLPMLEAVAETMPNISSGFLAMRRDELTHESRLFYDRLPSCQGKRVILVDVMLATGGSLCDALRVLQRHDVKEVMVLNVIASPEGIEKVQSEFPDVKLYIAQVDECLNDDKFITPGLGDAGDRQYNTLV